MTIVHTLRTDLEKCSTASDGPLLVSVITVMCIVHKFSGISNCSEQDLVEIVDLLRESYKPGKGTCPAFSALENHLTETKFRYKIKND